jgi:hypothetical protein
MKENYKKIAGIKFTPKEYEVIKKRFFTTKEHYIIRYDTIYQLFYSVNAGLYAQKIYTKQKGKGVGLTKKGFHMFSDAAFVNKLLDFQLLNA